MGLKSISPKSTPPNMKKNSLTQLEQELFAEMNALQFMSLKKAPKNIWGKQARSGDKHTHQAHTRRPVDAMAQISLT